MSQSDHRPSAPADVSLRRGENTFTLVFVRELRHSPDRVWLALTDPGQLGAWAPFDPDRPLDGTGSATLTMAGGGGSSEKLPCSVLRAERPRLLEYTWGEDVLRWELEAIATGTRLVLSHTMQDRGFLPKVAAGWHICLEVADRLLAGQRVPRIVGAAAKEHGWEQLRDMYAARLGLDAT